MLILVIELEKRHESNLRIYFVHILQDIFLFWFLGRKCCTNWSRKCYTLEWNKNNLKKVVHKIILHCFLVLIVISSRINYQCVLQKSQNVGKKILSRVNIGERGHFL
jgi:hypothetical protein